MVPARCYLTDPTDQFWSPVGAINYVKPPERNFVTGGEFKIALPPRTYKLVVERGPEYRAITKQVVIQSGESREERIELQRWVNMNARGWYSGDLHNHRDVGDMDQLMLAEDLNIAPTLTEWVWEDSHISRAPKTSTKALAIRRIDDTHVYSTQDTEIERLREGPGAVDLVGLNAPISFSGYRLFPPSDVFTKATHARQGWVDAEKITWRDGAALMALGQVDFAGIVHNHFNRHGVETETAPWGMIPKGKPEYETPLGMALWTMDVYYKFLNCGFKLAVSAGSASGVKPAPLGFNRVYVHMTEKFGYRPWFRALKAGHSFGTNGPMLFLTVNGKEPGETIVVPGGAGKSSKTLKVHVEASTAGQLEKLEILWKGQVVKYVVSSETGSILIGDAEIEVNDTGWIAARAFEKSSPSIRFAQTSPVYVQVGSSRGIVAGDVKFFLEWMDSEIAYYRSQVGFKSESDRQAMLDFFRGARAVFERQEARGETLECRAERKEREAKRLETSAGAATTPK
ncbi:MAG: CehA/McbA family metallohydrolase [Terriglobia bacterium]